MAKCEMCGTYGETSDVVIANKATGESKSMDLCRDCALKSAAVIKAGGGEVQFVDGSRKAASSSGCMVILMAAAALGSSMLGVVFCMAF